MNPAALTTQLKSQWEARSLRDRALWVAVGCVVLAACVLGFARLRQPSFEVLFSRLGSDDAGRIVEQLRAARVPYELSDEGTTILVPSEQVHEVRLQLSASGLPSGGGVGFELFDKQRFGESEFTEQVQYRRALEGELSRTIGHLVGVESARIHLVVPQRSLFANADLARASVALTLRPGFRLNEEQVTGIVHLVASSVRNLDPSNVTLVDQNGRALTRKRTGENEAALDTAHDAQKTIEREREESIQDLLDATLGPGNSLVRVSANLSTGREERVEEAFDPERTATRSFQITTEGSQGATGAVSGIPGAASNLPGGPTPTSTGSTPGGNVRSETRNFEVSKVTMRAVEPVGRLLKLHVAVVVDGTWRSTGNKKNSKPEFQRRNEDELTRIRSFVSSAAGIDASRGDVVTVECVPFSRDRENASPQDPAIVWVRQHSTYLAAGAVALALLVLVVVVLMFRRKSNRPAPIVMSAEIARAIGDPQERALPTPSLRLGAPTEPESSGTDMGEELRRLASDIARKDPEVAARVVRGWLAEAKSDEKAAA